MGSNENLPPVDGQRGQTGLESPADSLANLSESSRPSSASNGDRPTSSRPISSRFQNIDSDSPLSPPKPPLHPTGFKAEGEIRPKVNSRKVDSSSHGRPLRPSSASGSGADQLHPSRTSGQRTRKIQSGRSPPTPDKDRPEGWGPYGGQSRHSVTPPHSISSTSGSSNSRAKQSNGAPSFRSNGNSPRFHTTEGRCLWRPKQRPEGPPAEVGPGGKPGFNTSTSGVNIPEYCALHDHNLSGHFEKRHVQKNLKEVGLMDPKGKVVELHEWRIRTLKREIAKEREQEEKSASLESNKQLRSMILKQRQYAEEHAKRLKIVSERKEEAAIRRQQQRQQRERLEKLKIVAPKSKHFRKDGTTSDSSVSSSGISPTPAPSAPSGTQATLSSSDKPDTSTEPKTPPEASVVSPTPAPSGADTAAA